MHAELLAQPVFRRFIATSENNDPLFYLSHRHYLSQRLSYRQRIGCAITHYAYEGSRHSEAYRDAVYQNGGLALWSKAVNGAQYSIRLCATINPRNEGGNSIRLIVDGACLCEMSYVWLDGSVVDAPIGIFPLITRNQSAGPGSDSLRRFRSDFPQNSPPYFCLAAMHGIARAHGRQQIAGIRHDCQIAYEPRYSRSFRNSYTSFWKAFGGTEVGGHAYLMPVTPPTVPIGELRPKHRGRALNRRGHWSNVTSHAIHAMTGYVIAEGGPRPHAVPSIGATLAVLLPTLDSLPPTM
jgi:uncharacterized protein VirK/YbjX